MSLFGGFLEARDEPQWTTQEDVVNGAGTDEATQVILNEFRSAAARSMRTSTIILASFNTIAAFATALSILYEARRVGRWRWSRGLEAAVGGGVYPLVLSMGIVVQGIIFAVAQSAGLDALVGTGCTAVSQLVFPAVVLVPYIQLVFAVEITTRAFRKQAFAPRNKWTVTVLLLIIILLILATFLAAHFDQAQDFCFTSLFWFAAHWPQCGFGLLTAIASLLLICTVGVFTRLHQSIKIDTTERVAAFSMVYYMALAFLSTTFLIPFFFVISFVDQQTGRADSLTLSTMACVVANVQGLMTGGLYLFLKSNAGSRGRREATEQERLQVKHKSMGYDPEPRPSPSDRPSTYTHHLRRTDSEASLASRAEPQVAVEPLLRTESQRTVQHVALLPMRPGPAQVSPVLAHARKPSYSLFPCKKAAVETPAITLMSVAYTQPQSMEVQPPTSLSRLAAGRHRISSIISSATVQIGLRFSNANDISPMIKSPATESVHEPDCTDTGTRMSPVRLRPEVDDLKSFSMKQLPPLPKPVHSPITQASSVQTLSPAVYKPAGPGRSKQLPRSQSQRTPEPRSPLPLGRRASETSIPSRDAHNRANWI